MKISTLFWKRLVAIAVFIGIEWAVYQWQSSLSLAMAFVFLCFTGLLIAPVIAFPLFSKKPWRVLLIYAVIAILLYMGVPLWLKAGARKFDEETSPDGKYTVEFYRVKPSFLLILSSGEDHFYVKLHDNRTQRVIFTSDITTGGAGTDVSWPHKDNLGRGKYTLYIGLDILIRLPE